jgi:hypothetical protein
MADATLEFLAAAREFRKALAADVEQGEFARQVRNALARVYLAAALLGRPGAAEHDSDLPEQHPTTDESGTFASPSNSTGDTTRSAAFGPCISLRSTA